jgi:diguanylate cyclase (GGDEF)-like protein
MRRYVPLALTVFIGMSITAAVFFVFLGTEQTRLRADFQNMSSDRAQAIRSAIAEDSIELDLMASYVAASAELGQRKLGEFVQEFGRFVRRVPAQEEDAQVLAFVSVLTGAERTSFEALMRKEVSPGFAVREQGEAGTLQPAGNRTNYYPVVAMEPAKYSGAVLGLDLGTVPGFRESLDHAVASGKITATQAVNLPLSASGPFVVWNFLAVYRGDPTDGISAARGELLGIAVSAFRIDEMVELSLKNLSPAGIDLELTDPNAPQEQRQLYYHHSRSPGYSPSGVARTGLAWSATINAGERSWTLTAYPTTGFISRHRGWQSWTLLAGGVLLTVFLGFYFAGRLRRAARVESLVAERTSELAVEVAKHETLERSLAESRTTLAGQVVQLHQKNQQILLLNEVGDALQSCLSTDEAYPAVSLHAPRLLPGTSGTLFINDAAKGLYSGEAEWGAHHSPVAAFKAEDCWALRRGKAHAVTLSSANLPCRHTAASREEGSLCIPLATIGRTMGLLHVTHCTEESHAFILSVADRIGLALSNLMLRSDLRQLSIHDPLTSLYNRRYMEEAVEVEIHRAARKEHPIGIIMLDIDHFKAFNDGFSHAAGDELLRLLGALISGHLRAGDIACRYGGEEFLLILPEATEESSIRRAEDLRERAQKLEIRYLEKPLGAVTISLGVATYPARGRTRDELFAAADAALYRAKETGRNRVVVAGSW